MSREDYIASWVVDSLMGTGGRELPAACPKSQLREVVKKAIADAEETWPAFERELGVMHACADVGAMREGGAP